MLRAENAKQLLGTYVETVIPFKKMNKASEISEDEWKLLEKPMPRIN